MMNIIYYLNQRAYAAFYDTYAPSLWGIIMLANLPISQSEIILVNTLAKAWKQFDQRTRSEKHFFTRLISLAREEGLCTDCLKTIPGFNQLHRV